MQVLLGEFVQNIGHNQTLLCIEADQTVLVRRTEIATVYDDQRFDLSLRFLDKLISAVTRLQDRLTGSGCLRWMLLGWRASMRVVTMLSSRDA